MIIIDNFYKFQKTNIEEDFFSLTVRIEYDLKQYGDFRNYCSEKFFQQTPISIEWNKKTYKTLIENSSFNLGVIEYNKKGEIESFNTLAKAILKFKILNHK